MSRENVEIVKEFTSLFEAGDRDSWRTYWDPEAIWDTSASQMLMSGVESRAAALEAAGLPNAGPEA